MTDITNGTTVIVSGAVIQALAPVLERIAVALEKQNEQAAEQDAFIRSQYEPSPEQEEQQAAAFQKRMDTAMAKVAEVAAALGAARANVPVAVAIPVASVAAPETEEQPTAITSETAVIDPNTGLRTVVHPTAAAAETVAAE